MRLRAQPERVCWHSISAPRTTGRPAISGRSISRQGRRYRGHTPGPDAIRRQLGRRHPRAVDFLEHIADKVALINELYRALAPGGLPLSQTPSTDGRGAYQDPTHVAFYNENSFWYYTERQYRNFVPQIEAAFQVSRLVTYFPTEWHEQHRIPYVTANLIALKDSTPRNGGRLMI
jgi:hypothetical protein